MEIKNKIFLIYKVIWASKKLNASSFFIKQNNQIFNFEMN